MSLLVAVGCGLPAVTPSTDVEPRPQAEPDCAQVPATTQALAHVEADGCPLLALSYADSRVKLVDTRPGAAKAVHGEIPQPCVTQSCTWSGAVVGAHTLLVVEVRTPQSDLPGGAWLGYIDGDALAFIDLWAQAGPEVWDTGTYLGPALALAPVDCGGELAIRARARTVAGASIAVPTSLRARERFVRTNESLRPEASCTALPLAIP